MHPFDLKLLGSFSCPRWFGMDGVRFTAGRCRYGQCDAAKARIWDEILRIYAVLSANMRFMFQAMVTRFHSPRTSSSPRNEN